MNDKISKPLFHQLQDRWPETDNYLERVGQINNDLLTLREIDAHEKYVPGWLERLAIGKNDLVKKPNAIRLLALLHQRGVSVPSRMTVPAFREIQREYELSEEGEKLFPEDSLDTNPNYDVLDSTYLTTVGTEGDAQLLALPGLESALKSWVDQVMSNFLKETPPVTLAQAFLMAHLAGYLLQEQARPELWEDSLRSLRSSKFFERAGNRQ